MLFSPERFCDPVISMHLDLKMHRL